MYRHAFIFLIRPVQGGACAVVIVFSLLMTLAANAGLMGLPLAILLGSWFLKYAYVYFDHIVRGFNEPPVLDIGMMNPVSEQRPLGQLIIGVAVYAMSMLTDRLFGPIAAVIVSVVAVLLLPACVAVLGLEGHLLKAANPLEWIKVVRGLGGFYVLSLALDGVLLAGVVLLWHSHAWQVIRIGASLYAVLTMFSVLAGVLYLRRFELGLEVWSAPELTQARQVRHDLARSETVVADAYGQMRAGSHIKCWEILQSWLAQGAHEVGQYHWLYQRLAHWEDTRYVTRLSEDYLERLIALKKSGDALDLVAERLRVDPTFRPKTASSTLELAQLCAHGGGKRQFGRQLLSDFERRFPGDVHISAAATLLKRLQQ